MKEALRERRTFSSNEEAIGVVQNWLKTQPKTFSVGIKGLVKNWN
jgi:hypothetical protein